MRMPMLPDGSVHEGTYGMAGMGGRESSALEVTDTVGAAVAIHSGFGSSSSSSSSPGILYVPLIVLPFGSVNDPLPSGLLFL